MSSHIRIVGRLGPRWVWRLVTSDGHVANESAEFANRDDCETEAIKQGLPVQGLSKAKRALVQESARLRTGLRVYSDRTGLWRWTFADDLGKVIARSSIAYLTKDDAVGDADAHAPRPTDL